MSKYVGEKVVIRFGDLEEHKFHTVGENNWVLRTIDGIEYWEMQEVVEVALDHMTLRTLSPFVELEPTTKATRVASDAINNARLYQAVRDGRTEGRG